MWECQTADVLPQAIVGVQKFDAMKSELFVMLFEINKPWLAMASTGKVVME
jgi:hypothetical protein